MGYMRAEDILPEDVLALVQQYVDGQMLYIPRKSGEHKSWGAGTETKKDLMIRNRQMVEAYQSGVTVDELSERYYLTQKSIRRIIREYKN